MSEADLKACRKWHATNAKGLGVSLFVTSDQIWNEKERVRFNLGGTTSMLVWNWSVNSEREILYDSNASDIRNTGSILHHFTAFSEEENSPGPAIPHNTLD